MRNAAWRIAIAATMAASSLPLSAQWPPYPTSGVPKTPDGKPAATAPAPRTADGKPDFSGIWIRGDGQLGPAGGGTLRAPAPSFSVGPPVTTFRDVGANVAGGLPLQPWAIDLVKARRAENSKDNPDAHCLPMGVMQFHNHGQPRKIVQTPGLIVIMYEANYGLRHIFMDGRHAARRRCATVVVWVFNRQVGRRHARRRNDGLQGRRMARYHRQSVDRCGEAHRAVPSAELRNARNRRHDRRSEGVHEAMDRSGEPAHRAR